MAAPIHPAATEHLPAFITGPGETDVLMVVTAIILLGSVVAFGVLFLRLHTMPERMAHKSHKLQFEIVAVLGLLALFTHMHIFWVAGLLLALIDIPDIGGWLGRIAGSVEKIADNQSNQGSKVSDVALADPQATSPIKVAHERVADIRLGDAVPIAPQERARG
jgi:hypothetical protein